MRKIYMMLLGMLSVAIAGEAAQISQNEQSLNVSKKSEQNLERWTGFTIGLNAGGIVNTSDAILRPSGDFLLPFYVDDNPLRTDKINLHGGAYSCGLQVGGNYQYQHFVIGLETDFNYSSINKKNNVSRTLSAPLAGTFSHRITDRMNWFGTIRPRIGCAFDPILIYATGGYLYGHVKSSTHAVFSRGNDTYIGSMSKVLSGWNVGGGLEWGFLKKWSMKFEYLYLNFEKHHYVSPVTDSDFFGDLSYTTDLKNKGHLIRIGFNYTI